MGKICIVDPTSSEVGPLVQDYISIDCSGPYHQSGGSGSHSCDNTLLPPMEYIDACFIISLDCMSTQTNANWTYCFVELL